MILAKPVVPERHWILQQGTSKIGELESDGSDACLKIRGHVPVFTTIADMGHTFNIRFEPAVCRSDPDETQVHGYPTGCKTHNPVWDVKKKLPLFTKEENSKSWYAAGWYRVRQHRNWKTVQNPKLITLQRYPYQGPFHSREQANDQSI